MENQNENSPLLHSANRHDHQPRTFEDSDDETVEFEEETLDNMMARFGSSVGSLGLGGAIQGAPLMRRGSISTRPQPLTRRLSQARSHKRGSVVSIASVPDQTSDEDYDEGGTQTETSPFEVRRHRPSISKAPLIDDSSSVEGPAKGSKYLGGVSNARFWAIFSSILLVYFVACFDSTLMASSHPVITSYFHASNSASWLSTSFLLTSTAFQPMFGRISDTFGRKAPFLFSLAAFGIGTLWCALAKSIISFIMARAVCGFGAGGAMAMGAIINSDLVPIEIRGSYQSLLNLAFGIGSSLGAAMGGFLADALGWQWEFGIQVPAVLLAFVVAWITTPDNLGPQLAKRANVGFIQTMREFDLAGSFFLTSCVTLLIVAMNLGGNVFPWTHPLIIAAFVVSIMCGAGLILVEGRTEKPIMPLEFLFSAPRGNLVFSNFFASMTMNTILFNLPLYFQAVLLDTPTRSGTRLVLPFCFNMAAGFSTGFVITYSTRLKPTLLLGYSLMLLGSILLAIMNRSFPSWVYTQFIAASSMGQGFSYPSISLSMLATSTIEDLAVATSTLILWRSLGTVMGVAFSSLIVQNSLRYYLDQFVVGPQKAEVINKVRKSVEIVIHLPPGYQEEVIHAYSAALRWSFICAAATSALALLLVIRIKLPRLRNKSEAVPAGE